MIDDEPGLRVAGHEVLRLFGRAAKRPLLTFALALLVTAVLVERKTRTPRMYTTTIVLRVEETDLEPGTSPRAAKHLRTHILDAVFTNLRLLKVMEQRNIYSMQRQLDDQMALEAFRDDMEVDVWRNYFLAERFEFDPARSARVAIRYSSPVPETSFDVANDLARMITDTEARSRELAATRALETARANLAAAEQENIKQRGLVAQKIIERRYAMGEKAMRLEIEMRALVGSFDALDKRVSEQSQRTTDLEVRYGIEKGGIGLRFDVADPGRVPRKGASDTVYLSIFGLIVFALLFPLSALAVGAFDPRIRDREDLDRFGIEMLGSVPRFTGDAEGSMKERLAKNARVQL